MTAALARTELERLLLQLRELGGVLLGLDAYERWGAQHDTEEARNKASDEAARATLEHERTTRELTELVARTRREAPHEVIAWAEAHVLLLTEFIETHAQDAGEDTARFVADEERSKWREVAAGTLAFVQENGFYVHVGAERRKALLGV